MCFYVEFSICVKVTQIVKKLTKVSSLKKDQWHTLIKVNVSSIGGGCPGKPVYAHLFLYVSHV